MLKFKRLLSTGETHPFDDIEWETKTIEIPKDNGELLYSCPDAEFPASWSQMACQIVASKYFRESRIASEKETSVKTMVARVVNAICAGGVEHEYFTEEDGTVFGDELSAILVNQMASLNSPVWFNLGVGGVAAPQCSACFINDVDDTMESIAELATKEMLIFKEGSGSGVNFSKIRGSNEPIRGGGTASGPVSFMEGLDAFANVILSGGRTRRAARMCILNGDHPDILKFIEVKAKHEKTAVTLAKAGISTDFTDPEGVYTFVKHQSSNLSVRLTDDFMRRVQDVMHYSKDSQWELVNRTTSSNDNQKVSVKEMFDLIAQSAHTCGDPGVQFHDTINSMNTCSNDGEIEGSNPCFTGDTLLATPQGFIPIEELCRTALTQATMTPVYTKKGVVSTPTAYMATGMNPILRVELSDGRVIKCTENHKWLIEGNKIEAKDLKEGMPVSLLTTPQNYKGNDQLEVDGSANSYRKTRDHHLNDVRLPVVITPDFAALLGHLTGDGFISNKENYHMMGWVYGTSTDAKEDQDLRDLHRQHNQLLEKYTPGLINSTVNTNGCTVLRYSRRPILEYFLRLGFKKCKAEAKRVPTSIMRATKKCIAAYLRGYFGADGTVYGKATEGEAEVNCVSTSVGLLQDVQLLLQLFGISSTTKLTKKAGTIKFKQDIKTYSTHASYRLRINPIDLNKFATSIGFSVRYKQQRMTTLLANRKRVKAKWKTPTVATVTSEGAQPTYNLTEPTNHLVYANGLLIPQCGEFTWLNNSACNLASLNLLKYTLENKTLDIKLFKHVVRLLVIAQDILLEISGFPTEEIRQHSIDYRPLGLGYANIGGLLMSWGIAYDSDEGRNLAASITSLLTGTAYLTSMELAQALAPFKHYANNQEPMEDVLDKHYKATRQLPKDIAGIAPKAVSVWQEVMGVGCGRRRTVENPTGFRNCQTTLLAPTGTIAFMMDCATSGCEPDIGLRKTKRLVGGSSMTYTNPTVQSALERLGYEAEYIGHILDFVTVHGHVEGSGLKEIHYPVFDCAIGTGDRSLSVEAHVDFVAAIQPFVSGAISKTFNMPNDATPLDIQRAFLRAWEKGVKSITVYRRGSKLSEPLRVEELQEEIEDPNTPVRRRLPDDRKSDTHKVNIGGSDVFIIVGLYPGTTKPGEIFIKMSKYGATIGGLLDSYAIIFSKMLQYGIPLDRVVSHMENTQFAPSGVTSNRDIPMAKSIMDYIAKLMLRNYQLPEEEGTTTRTRTETTGEVCPECGALMVRNGASCLMCTNCAASTGVCG